jgi:hypothetical protein
VCVCVRLCACQLPVITLEILQLHLAVGDSLDIYADAEERQLITSIPGTGQAVLKSASGSRRGLQVCPFGGRCGCGGAPIAHPRPRFLVACAHACDAVSPRDHSTHSPPPPCPLCEHPGGAKRSSGPSRNLRRPLPTPLPPSSPSLFAEVAEVETDGGELKIMLRSRGTQPGTGVFARWQAREKSTINVYFVAGVVIGTVSLCLCMMCILNRFLGRGRRRGACAEAACLLDPR